MNTFKKIAFLSISLLMGFSCAKEVQQEPINPQQIEQGEQFEVKARVELSLEGLTDIELPENEGRALLFNPAGNPYLKIDGTSAKTAARVYFVPKTGGEAISGTAEATLTMEGNKVKVALKGVVVPLPKSINTTETWLVSVILGGKTIGDKLVFNSEKMLVSDAALPEFGLPVVSDWMEVKVVPGVPSKPELGGASPVTHRAEQTDPLNFKVQGTVLKVTPSNSLIKHLTAYDIRLTSNKYTAGMIGFKANPTISAAALANGERLRATIDKDGVDLPAAGGRTISVIPLGKASNEYNYKPLPFYVEGDGERDKLNSSVDIDFLEAGDPVYLMLYPLPKADALVAGSERSYLNVTVGWQDAKNASDRVLSVSKKEVLEIAHGTTSGKVVNNHVQSTRLAINSEPMITEIYMRTNDLGENVGFIELYNPSVFWGRNSWVDLQRGNGSANSMSDYGLVRMYHNGSTYKFYPNADNLANATVLPLKFARRDNLDIKQEKYSDGSVLSTQNARVGEYSPYGAFKPFLGGYAGMLTLVGMRGQIREKTASYWDTRNVISKKSPKEGRQHKDREYTYQYEQESSVAGKKFSWAEDNERYMFREIFDAYYMMCMRMDYRQDLPRRESTTWGRSRIAGIYCYDDAQDLTQPVLAHTDASSGVMNGSKDDTYLLVRKSKSGAWSVVDMAGPIHNTAFAGTKQLFTTALPNEKAQVHHVRHRVTSSITAISTEFESDADRQLLDARILPKLWTVAPFRFERNKKIFEEASLVAPYVPNTSLGYRAGDFRRVDPYADPNNYGEPYPVPYYPNGYAARNTP